MAGELLENIQSRGYWKIVLHPATFVEKRVDSISDLFPMLQKISVELRGWDYPHLDPHIQIHKNEDWIEQGSKVDQYLELWRFYQSGQFVDLLGMEEDWLAEFHDWPLPKNSAPGSYLSVKNAVYIFTEIFEFAARLALTSAGDDQMHLEIGLHGLKGRGLKLETRRRGSSYLRKYRADIDKLSYVADLTRTELISNSREVALKPAIELFARFGWNTSLDVLRDIQDGLLGYRPAAAAHTAK